MFLSILFMKLKKQTEIYVVKLLTKRNFGLDYIEIEMDG